MGQVYLSGRQGKNDMGRMILSIQISIIIVSYKGEALIALSLRSPVSLPFSDSNHFNLTIASIGCQSW